jgi:hypothetical protein
VRKGVQGIGKRIGQGVESVVRKGVQGIGKRIGQGVEPVGQGVEPVAKAVRLGLRKGVRETVGKAVGTWFLEGDNCDWNVSELC